ncbi:MAG: sulfite exporter TauE/SafE family protein [Myxococcota bacterium]
MDYLDWPLAIVIAAGFVAGFINTMAGGGSLITLPALMLTGLPADIANGTNRLGVVTQSVAGIVGYARAGKLTPRAIPPIVLPTGLGALIGALLASYAPKEVLKPVLLGTMMAMAAFMVFAPKSFAADPEDEPSSLRDRPAGAVGLFVAGVYGGFVQAGVGFVLLAVLGALLRYDLVRANALKLSATLVFGVVALAVFVARDQVSWIPAAALAVASAIGSLVGVRFALKVHPRVLRGIILLAVIGMSAAVMLR